MNEVSYVTFHHVGQVIVIYPFFLVALRDAIAAIRSELGKNEEWLSMERGCGHREYYDREERS